MATAATTEEATLQVGDLSGTLASAALLAAFRGYLRALDGKAKAAPEIKG